MTPATDCTAVALLTLELSARYEFVRHELATYFSWFSFFLTIIFAMMGWALKYEVSRSAKKEFPLLFVVILAAVLVQIVLAIVGTTLVHGDMTAALARAQYLVTSLNGSCGPACTSQVAIPEGYGRTLLTARTALLFNLILWSIVGAVILRGWRRANRK